MTDETLTITRHPSPGGGEYRAKLEGHEATGLLTWQNATGRNAPSQEGPVWIADHTLVPSAIGGRGIAAKLVEALINDARKEGARIVPACSYVAVAFARHPEWADLKA
ncbi:GNAT family N-acetyltransferase [Novosphingobium rosa]|uniref:GNAT family N-acetyltransferase n=1 Tax=Novosphingobium rosa TaxID=76978 RepID=UPI000836F84D|nr:GNAT family N-acetyltransferase [Novosphingobium rosa]